MSSAESQSPEALNRFVRRVYDLQDRFRAVRTRRLARGGKGDCNYRRRHKSTRPITRADYTALIEHLAKLTNAAQPEHTIVRDDVEEPTIVDAPEPVGETVARRA